LHVRERPALRINLALVPIFGRVFNRTLQLPRAVQKLAVYQHLNDK